ncbi:MAG: hypothetical protein U0V87_04750 [Acidobacteriota bacterium]
MGGRWRIVEPLADLGSFGAGRSMSGIMIGLEIDGVVVPGLDPRARAGLGGRGPCVNWALIPARG